MKEEIKKIQEEFSHSDLTIGMPIEKCCEIQTLIEHTYQQAYKTGRFVGREDLKQEIMITMDKL